jgi:hypothetical protein
LWRTIPFLLVSPILSIFVHDHDILIYLVVLYTFLLLLLYQYRNLCHEWSNWPSNIPNFKEEDISAWYSKVLPYGADREQSDKGTDEIDKSALLAFRTAVEAHRVGLFRSHTNDLVAKVAKALPLISWLLEKDNETIGKKDSDAKPVELFTKFWFAQLDQALTKQKDLARGLKEHSIFVLFRHGKYDVRTPSANSFMLYEGNMVDANVVQFAQPIGLFFIALMDHWVNVAMSARQAPPGKYEHKGSRYGMGLCVLYFLLSAIAVDVTLQPHWGKNSKLSDEKLFDCQQVKFVAQAWTRCAIVPIIFSIGAYSS